MKWNISFPLVRAAGLLALNAAMSLAHASYVTGQQYTFSGGAERYFLSGSFTVGSETSAGSGVFDLDNFLADSSAPGIDVLGGFMGTVTSDGFFSVSFTLSGGYLPAGADLNTADIVSLSGTDRLSYTAIGAKLDKGTIVDDYQTGHFATTLVAAAVPEPGTLALLGIAGIAAATGARGRKT